VLADKHEVVLLGPEYRELGGQRCHFSRALARSSPNRLHQNRTISRLISVQRSSNGTSTFLNDNGSRAHINYRQADDFR
jgi:hypothetical protein